MRAANERGREEFIFVTVHWGSVKGSVLELGNASVSALVPLKETDYGRKKFGGIGFGRQVDEPLLPGLLKMVRKQLE